MNPPESPRRLGRGLDALLSRKDPIQSAKELAERASGKQHVPELTSEHIPKLAIRQLPIADIRANPYQPRQEFHADDLADLEASIKATGLLQPITVRSAPSGNGFELIAGERRLRASINIGATDIAAIVREVDDKTLLTLAMVENLQRSDLDPIEEADGYHRMMDEFHLSQQEVADIVGKDRSTVANAVRLRQLPTAVKRLLQEKKLSAGHARALLSLGSERNITDIARQAVENGWSVREVERRSKAAHSKTSPTKKPATASATTNNSNSAEVRRLEELLRKKLQTAVKIHLSGKDKGSVHIEFYSNDDLERLLELLGVNPDF